MRKLFDFYCQQCKNKQEHLVRDNDVLECPKCGSKEYKKVGGSGSFNLKGGGYYVTDFK